MLRRLAVSLPLVLTTLTLGSCGLIGDLAGSSALDDALGVLPESATDVTFVDRRAVAERLEVDDVETGADEADVARYAEAVADQPVTEFAISLATMQDFAFSELDIEWEVRSGDPDAAPVTVWKLADDVDLDQLADDLVELGYEESELAGHPSFTIEPFAMDPSSPLRALFTATVIEDERLLVSSPEPEPVIEVVDDGADSAADSGELDEVLGAAEDVEYAHLQAEPACGSGAALGQRATPEQVEAAREGLEAMGSPTASAFFSSADGETSNVFAFEDDAAAESDLEARDAYYADGLDAITAQPLDDLATWDVERDGELVVVTHVFEGGFRTAYSADQGVGGFDVCALSG